MGVHGLTTYISENSDLYLKPYELSDCCVVIDGSSVAFTLLYKLKSHSAFGGDYDEYFAVVKSFMLALKKCNVYPIVLFDGSCDKDKKKKRLSCRRSYLLKLKCFCQGFSKRKYYILFMKEVFINVMRDLGFSCVQCNTEADGEIAAVARKLNCPVISYDSDYFIYNVMYIPTNTVTLSPFKHPDLNKYYIRCSIYNPDDFLETIGIQKPLLPVLAALLGNDQVGNLVFFKFFNHVKVRKIKNKSCNQRRVYGLVEWLRNENSISALQKIIGHLRKVDTKRALKVFRKVKNFYNNSTISESVSVELAKKFGEIYFTKNNCKVNWPSEIAKLYAQAFIPNFSMNIIEHQYFLTPLQVENIYNESSHFKCLNLIRKIYTMLAPYATKKRPLRVYLIIKKKYSVLKIDTDPDADYVNLNEVIKQPQEKRINLLCNLVGIPIDNLKFVPQNSWAIFVMSVLYWVKEYYDSLSQAHIHAFVIMMIANKIVQGRVGYNRKGSSLMKRYEAEIEKLKHMESSVNKSTNFEEMLSNVELYECIFAQKELIPLRLATAEGSEKGYCISTVHLFNCFQSCLYFITVINALLNHPLPHLRVEEFYSGTLLFNLYKLIKSKTSVEIFGSSLFSKTPNLDKIYQYLSAKLCETSGLTNTDCITVKKKRKKKKKKKNNNDNNYGVEVLEDMRCLTDDEGEFIDEANIYSALLKINDLSIC